MSAIQINIKTIDKKTAHANTFASKPISMKDFMWVAIQMKAVVHCFCDEELGENTDAASYRTTDKKSV